MKRLLLVAALLLAGCGGGTAAAPTSRPAPLAQSFAYMSDLLDALSTHNLACPDYRQADAGVDTNVREVGNCSGFMVALLTVDLSKPEMSAVRGIYSMKAPYTFMDANWVIWTDTAENAKKIGELIGYEPFTA